MPGNAIDVVLALMIIVSFFIAIIFHEFSHALLASLLGDRTPRLEGRQSLNPREHIDPMGMLLCVIMAFFPVAMLPVGLGWGKPVKTDPWKLRGGPNGGTLIVALGGMLASLALGLAVGALMRFLPVSLLTDAITARLVQFVAVFACTNIVLAIFNILPFYPLDGYQIVYSLLPSQQAVSFSRSAKYGPFIILFLLFFLPFLGQLTGMSGLFIFHLPAYMLLGSSELVSLVSGLDAFRLYFLM